MLEEGASHQLAGLQWCRFLIGGDDILIGTSHPLSTTETIGSGRFVSEASATILTVAT